MNKKMIAGILAFATAFSSLAMASCTFKKSDALYIARWSSETDKPKLEALKQQFMAENPDIKIEWEFKEYQTHFSTIRNDLMGEAAADIIFMNNWGLNRLHLEEKDKSMFVNFNEVEMLNETRASILPAARDRMKVGDSVIGIPVGLVTRVPVINATIWETVSTNTLPNGIPYNRTEAFTGKELTDLLKKVGNETNILMGLNVTPTEALHMFLASVDAPLIYEDANGAQKVGCNNPAGWAAAQQFQDFMLSGQVVPYTESGGGSLGTVDNAIINEKCLAGWANFATLNNLGDYYAMSGQTVATIAPFKAADITLAKGMDNVAGTADDGQVIESKDVAYGDYNALIIPSFSKKKEEAYRFIKWLLEKEQQLTYAKMADIPVNSEAFEVVTTNSDGNWDPKYYSSYKIGLDNLYVAPITSSFFSNHFGKYFADLCKGNISGKQFCQSIAAGEHYLDV